MAKDEQAAVLQQRGEVLVVEHLLGERLRTLVDVFVAVGRVGQDEVEFSPAAAQLGKRDERIHGFELRLAKLGTDRPGIALHDSGVLGGQLDECG